MQKTAASKSFELTTMPALFQQWRTALPYAALALAVAVVYADVYANSFVLDDRCLIFANEFLKQWKYIPGIFTNLNFAGCGAGGGFYRPVQILAYFFVYQAFGASTIAFHALNIAVHALNACLLHYFGIRAGFKKGAAFTAALLWAAHPLHVINVAYMSSTAELLWSTFSLLGLIALLPDFSPRKIWTSAIFFLLALGCKESAVVFPALAAITIFFVSSDRLQTPAYFRTWPLWLMAAGYIILWSLYMHATGYTMNKTGGSAFYQSYTSDFINRTLTSLATLPVYARLMIWPAGLHVERNFPVVSTLTWPAMAGILMVSFALLQILWGRARQGLALSFGLLWFAVALSPYTNIIIPINARISEGWLYMPTMGLFLGVVQTVSVFFEKNKNIGWFFVPVMALALGAATFYQNRTWQNSETLYLNVLKNGGNINRLVDNLGVYYLKQGEFDKAAEQFRYVLKRFKNEPSDKKNMWPIHLRLAIALLQIRLDDSENVSDKDVLHALSSCPHIPEAVSELGEALKGNPDYVWAHNALATIYHYQGNDAMADFHRKQAENILRAVGAE